MSHLTGIPQRISVMFRRRSISRCANSLFCAGAALLLLVGPRLDSLQTTAATPRQQSEKQSPALQQAEALIQQGKFEEAKAAIQSELKKNPSSVEADDMLGFIYVEQKDFAQALESFQKALRIAPNSAKTHNLLGTLYIADNRIDLAEKEFQTTLRIDPKNQEANYNLGLFLLSKKQPSEAVQYLERVRPPNIPTRFNLIRAYLEDKQPKDALHLATELSEQNPKDVQLHFTLGVLLASEKQYKQA